MRSKHLIGLMVILLGFINMSDQQFPQDLTISVDPGVYSADSLIHMLREGKVDLSYSSSAINQEDIQLSKETYSLQELLSKIFDFKAYRPLIRNSKVLIVPRKPGELNSSGGLFEIMPASDWRYYEQNPSIPA